MTYSLFETVRAYIAIAKIKQVVNKPQFREASNDFFKSLVANSVVISENVDPLDDIVIGVDPNPLDDIVVGVDPNPPYAFDAAIEELNVIASSECREEVRLGAEDLISKLNKIAEVLESES